MLSQTRPICGSLRLLRRLRVSNPVLSRDVGVGADSPALVALHVALRHALVRGLSDDTKDVRRKMYSFWDEKGSAKYCFSMLLCFVAAVL